MSTKKRKTTNRKATTRSVSMMPADWEWLENRIKSFGPLVKGTSHYFQILMEYDKRTGLIGSTERPPSPTTAPKPTATRRKTKKME